MSGPSEWVLMSSAWERRAVGEFALYASDYGRYEVTCGGEMLDRADIEGGDSATAKRAAEDALRRLLVEALEALGPGD